MNLHLIHFIERIYSDQRKRNSYNYLNDDSSKYFSLNRGDTTFNIIVLHPSNGSHITTKIVTPPGTPSSFIRANGRFANNLILIHFPTTSPSGDNLILVNTDDWNVTTYVSSSSRNLHNYLPMFDTDQIMLLFTSSGNYFTIQAAYDKFHNTEFYSL